eukprot:CAMPEP_0206222214 /NCGR_PEP_ID=MMETSP0047_2-20121206/5838_1 /ASSEMBLY_ACC=CAM_ASM_000192 /TAXON_ID=195065 /ORGANISM="Chroomonas mesostigmatica_cf, Strain CCMP1168" /LENGTH=941 /DNA_ID=CAMNT_0053645019 /DNA_START=140 /DNA_END=2965 /DNA_ORIENTATION=+
MAAEMAACQYGIFTLFGTIWFTFFSLQLWKHLQSRTRVSDSTEVHGGGGGGGKVHHGPLELSLGSINTFVTECSQFCVILFFAYCCEHYPLYPPGERLWDRDTFYFLMIIYAIAMVLTIKEGKQTDILNRDQTEEWKGWMQYIFLMYHYYSAAETYNFIRVFITCYVWMTGFGNFSFFYIKRDFGIARVLQMFWRLNFLVFLLMMTMNNHYITYYICPLHTFYFFMTMFTMRILSGINHTVWSIRAKLMAVCAIIYVVWDLFDGWLFNLIWSPFLSTEPIRGAKVGTLWEWYFRTSLDKYSAIWGMLFALNFPAITTMLLKTEDQPAAIQWSIKGAAVLVWGAATVWWLTGPFQTVKNEYNLGNAYYAPIPMIFYILVRNISATGRRYYCNLPHFLGKLTLETYLMQYHCWLSNSATALLTIVPGKPLINALIATCMFVFLSHRLNYLTLSLRGQLLPDDTKRCLYGAIGFCVTFAIYRVIGGVLAASAASAATIMLVSCVLGGCMVAFLLLSPAVDRKEPLIKSDSPKQAPSTNMLFALLGVAIVGMYVFGSVAFDKSNAVGDIACHKHVLEGKWTDLKSRDCSFHNTAFCETSSWEFTSPHKYSCNLQKLNTVKATGLVAGSKIVFVGDQTAMLTFAGAVRALGGKVPPEVTKMIKDGSDMEVKVGSTTLSYVWAGKQADVANKIAELGEDGADVLVLSSGIPAALNGIGEGSFKGGAKKIADAVWESKKSSKRHLTVFTISECTVVDSWGVKQWKDSEKTILEAGVQAQRDASGELYKASDLVLDGAGVTKDVPDKSINGLLYTDDVYDVLAQQMLNALKTLRPVATTTAPLTGGGRVPGGEMSRPAVGLGVLVLFLIGLVTFDSYLGAFAWPYQLLTGRRVTYEESYAPLIAKIFRAPRATPKAHNDSAEMKEGANGVEYQPVKTDDEGTGEGHSKA